LGTIVNIWGKRLVLLLSLLFLQKHEAQADDACLWGKPVFPSVFSSFHFTHTQMAEKVIKIYQSRDVHDKVAN
jgi:hypothetical protein